MTPYSRPNSAPPNRERSTAVEVSNTNGTALGLGTPGPTTGSGWGRGGSLGAGTMNRPDGFGQLQTGFPAKTPWTFFVEGQRIHQSREKPITAWTHILCQRRPADNGTSPPGVAVEGNNLVQTFSGGIKIESASYGANCGVCQGKMLQPILPSNATEKTKCRYVVNHKNHR